MVGKHISRNIWVVDILIYFDIKRKQAHYHGQKNARVESNEKVNNLPPSRALINSSTGTVMVFEADSALGSDMMTIVN